MKRRWAKLGLPLLALGLALALPEGAAALPEGPTSLHAELPSDQTLIYYNARMALREGDPFEALQLWLMRNTVQDQTGVVSSFDTDFHTVTWAALGELGVCQDGHPKDEEGAGLWPLALHNWVVRNMGRRTLAGRPRPFDAFEVSRQQRFVAIGDVVGSDELGTVRFFRGRCGGARVVLTTMGELPTAKISDRQVAARLLRHLLLESKQTLDPTLVRGKAVIDARLFDVHLKLTQLAQQEARQQSRARTLRGRQLGLGRPSLEAMRAEDPKTTLDPESEAAAILRSCVDWPVAEWMSLSPDRRRFLFDQARNFDRDAQSLDVIAMGIVDALIDAGEGEEVLLWIARMEGDQALIWDGARGQRLLNMDAESGFGERGVIALHRGVAHLERGELPEAMRTLAYAMALAPESGAADEVQQLSFRWLNYIAAQFEISEELLITLKALLPRREFALILEDLMWRAAFRADSASFQRGQESLEGRGALKRRLAWLDPLAEGDVGAFSNGIRRGLKESPSETLRFLEQLLQRLEREDAQVRAAHLLTLEQMRTLLRELPSGDEVGASQARKTEELMARSQAILEGLAGLGLDAPLEDRARALSPGSEVYAGAVRLAPADPLPWPFRAGQVAAPSIFTPMKLIPLEWRDKDGEWVLGWTLEG